MTYDYVNINVVGLQWNERESSTSNGSLKTLCSHKTGISMHVATQHNKYHLMWCATILALCFSIQDMNNKQKLSGVDVFTIHEELNIRFFSVVVLAWFFSHVFFRTFMLFFRFRCFSSPESNWVMFRSVFQTNWVSFTCVLFNDALHVFFARSFVGSFRSKSSQR